MSETDCKYPDCVNYSAKAQTYCCLACNCDHTDYIRLGFDKREPKGGTPS